MLKYIVELKRNGNTKAIPEAKRERTGNLWADALMASREASGQT